MTKTSRRHFLQRATATSMSLGLLPALGCQQQGGARAQLPDQLPDQLRGKDASQLLEACNTTTLDLFGEGPFYTQNPPVITNTMLAPLKEAGERLIISGRLFNIGCSKILPNTVIDVWHANAAGDYDNVGTHLRGQTLTDDQGFFRFETIRPGKYLNGIRYRPAHIHFKVTPPGSETLTTQLYFKGDPDLATDAATSVSQGRFDATDRIIALSTNLDGKLQGNFDIVING